MQITLPLQVETGINLLAAAGYKAYIVGGSVRDCIMGITPLDWDIATSAVPAEVAQVFGEYKVIETGLKHGTLTIIIDSLSIEITTFRIDGDYSDNRRPDTVEFTDDIMLDLSRRDFTMNALAYSPQEGIIDCFGGIEDISNKLIRCVGDADTRFEEDALRIIRGLRFASVLNFEIEEDTAESIMANCRLLNNIAAERIQKELLKLLCGKAVERILLDYRTVLFVIIPELETQSGFKQYNDIHIFDVYGHTIHSVASIPPEPELRMTMLLHDSGKPECFSLGENGIGLFHGHAAAGAEIARKVMPRLKFSNKFSEEVITLVQRHDLQLFDNPKELKKWLGKLGEPLFRKLLLVKRADTLSLSPVVFDRLKLIDELESQVNRLIDKEACLTIADLKVDGNDLITIGIPAGKAVGDMLDRLFDAVLDERVENSKSSLLDAVREFMKPTP